MKKRIFAIALPAFIFLSGCGEDMDTLDEKKLTSQCDSGHGYSCYKLATMHHGNLNIYPSTLSTSPSKETGARLAKKACENGDHYGCSLYNDYLGIGISKKEAYEQLMKSCFAEDSGSHLSCVNLVNGPFLSKLKEKKAFAGIAFDLAIKECKNGDAKDAPACYLASQFYLIDKSIKDNKESLRLLEKSCEIGKIYEFCKDASVTLGMGMHTSEDFAKFENAVNNGLHHYKILCESGHKDFCGIYLIKQEILSLPSKLNFKKICKASKEQPNDPQLGIFCYGSTEKHIILMNKLHEEAMKIAKIGCDLGDKRSCAKLQSDVIVIE